MTEKVLIVLSAIAFLWNQSQSAYSSDLMLRHKTEFKMRKVVDGIASFYADKFQGRRTASGERFNMNDLTCAHKNLPFGTKLLVKNARNGKSCVVTVNDRGPYHGSRVIDLSRAAARKIGITGTGRVICYTAPKKPMEEAAADLIAADLN